MHNALVQGRKVLTPVWWKAALHSLVSVHLLSTSGPPPTHSKKYLVNIVTGVEHDVKSDEMLLERIVQLAPVLSQLTDCWGGWDSSCLEGWNFLGGFSLIYWQS